MDILKRVWVALPLALLTLGATAARAQISPGELSQQHAFLEGMKNCLRCHDLGEGPSDEKCLACHKEIAVGIDNRCGYHFGVTGKGRKDCYECHSEHAGRDFQLVHWPRGVNNFDHLETGYELAGKHGGLKCRDCHRSDLIVEDMTRFGDQVDVARTFLGLGTDCVACHANEHRGQLGNECLTCHSNDGWKPAAGFDHRKTAYPLAGKHLAVACAGCHPTSDQRDSAYPASERFVRYTGLSFGNCTPCHRDAHAGSYGATCATCHNTAGWRDIPQGMFDHAKTRFPLAGRHAGLPCEKCHAPGENKAPLAHERCVDCHSDAHYGQFVARAGGGACEGCHTVDGFLPPLFTVADHANTRFDLTGAHRAQPCFACHPTARADDGKDYRFFAVDGTRCENCHRDVHAGQFSASSPPKDCTTCHGLDAWLPVAFEHDRDSGYKLEGEHRRVQCRGCHVAVTVDGNTFVRYKPIDPSCKTCHAAGQQELGR
jgi:hypothetical protein